LKRREIAVKFFRLGRKASKIGKKRRKWMLLQACQETFCTLKIKGWGTNARSRPHGPNFSV